MLGWLKPERAEGNTQVLQRDVAVLIRVEQLEGLYKVLPLLSSELLSVLAACLLASWGGGRVDGLGRQGHHLCLVKFVAGIRLSIKNIG